MAKWVKQMRTHEEYKSLTEARLEALFTDREKEFETGSIPRLLNDAMRYSLLAGGKRLRPCMLLCTCEMLGGDVYEAIDFACAMEMIHTYSLIHDDLPGMDNDTLRRGRATNHVVYGEGQAILAGDGLLSYAFETMLAKAASSALPKQNLIDAMRAIAEGAGVKGMVAGQCADLYAENKKEVGEDLLTDIHLGKTAAMFRGAMLAGAYLAGASDEAIRRLSAFADCFGRLFQVTDDILDVTAEESGFGKSKGKDAEEGKLTAVAVYGLEGAMKLSAALKDEALKALEGFGEGADYFRKLTVDMFDRKH